jgi:hypothetical protein
MVRRCGTATWCGNSGDFYTRWCGAVDAEKFISGEVEIQQGSYVRVFAPWFEFEDSALRLNKEQKLEIQRTLDKDIEYEGEKDLLATYGQVEDGVTYLGGSVREYDAWEQLAWRRYAIREECKRDRNIFDRDYPHSWQTAFQKSGNMRFSSSGLSAQRRMLAKVLPQHGVLEETGDRVSFRRTEFQESQVVVFEQAKIGMKYVLAVDPMTGASQVAGADPDLHSCPVLRSGFWDAQGHWRPPDVVARVIQCRWDIEILEPVLWRLARFYGSISGCLIAIEMNQDRGLTELLKKRGANLYHRQIFNQMEQRTTRALGFQTNEKTRENLVEKLAGAIRNYDEPGGGIILNDEKIIEQCENFVTKLNGRSEAAEGWHDDDVFGVGLGLTVIEHATVYFPQQNQALLPPDLRPNATAANAPSAYS